MPRFKANRWWAFVLALGLMLGSAVAAHAQSHGVASGAFVTNGDGDGGGQNPPTIGDPDVPVGGSKNGFHNGKPLGIGHVPGSPMGGGQSLGRVWTMWLGALLKLTRMRLFGI